MPYLCEISLILSSHLSLGHSSGILLFLSKIVCIISLYVLHGFPVSTKASRISTPRGLKESACSSIRNRVVWLTFEKL